MKLKYVKLVLEEKSSGAACVITQDATAEFFGWDKAFPGWYERFQDGYPGGKFPRYAGHDHGPRATGGKRLRICRDKRTTGYPAGKTHCFRMKGPWAKKHLVMLAEVAGDKFEWMEGKFGARIRRDEWMALAEGKR